MAIRKSTRVWLILLGAGVALIFLAAVSDATDFLRPIGSVLVLVSCAILSSRLLAFLLHKLFYRLSWRLAFSYFLIGVFPVPLLMLLLGTVLYGSLGQFEVFRVDQALSRIGSEMIGREIPGVQTARAENGIVAVSRIPALSPASPPPAWVGQVRSPAFVGRDANVFFAVSRTRANITDVFVLPVDDLFLARLAELSGVAVSLVSVQGIAEEQGVGLNIRVSKEEEKKVAILNRFVYPPEATEEDRSRSNLTSVTWGYTSPPILRLDGAKSEQHVVLGTRMSSRRALGDLFTQGALQNKKNWAWISFLVIGGILLCVYLIALLIAFLLVRTITSTVNRLSRATQKIAGGDFSVRIATRARDQVGDLARSFDSMAASLEGTVAERAQKEFLDREIAHARTIAQKLLPPSDVAVPGLKIEAYFEPVAQLGGDYYDFLRTRKGETAVTIGDVSGHGLPTALLVAMAKAALATLLESGERGTALFSKMNNLIHRSTDTRNYMTLTLGVVDGDSEIEITNAGHPAPYRIRNGEVSSLDLPAFPLGLFDSKDFPTRRFPFSSGDRLVFYTDGIIEARDSQDDAFGFERFEELLRQHAARPLRELRAAVLDAVARHAVGGAIDDDCTLVIVERV
jgi:HAMP domain-containing protein